MNKKNLRRVSMLVSAQTLWHLQQEAAVAGYGEKGLGRVVDKWSRTKRAERSESFESQRKETSTNERTYARR